jgi:hypothetical protein
MSIFFLLTLFQNPAKAPDAFP